MLLSLNQHSVSLDELARKQLASFIDAGSSRLNIEGPELFINAEAAQTIGLALHELATNAAKYGALSVPAGKIVIRWVVQDGDDPHLNVQWSEADGPFISAPSRKGFGHIVVDEMTSRSLGAVVSLEFPPTGLVWNLRVPVRNLVFHSPALSTA